MTKEAFEKRIASLRPELIAIAKARLPQSDHEDAVQNAILSAWIHLSHLKEDRLFDPWVRRILINECVQILRSKKKQPEVYDSAKYEDLPYQKDDSLFIYEALSELNANDRELLLCHHEQGYSIGELSQIMNASEDAVKMRLYRARKRLGILLISMLILLLSMAFAVGAGKLDISWFFKNRRSEPISTPTDSRSDLYISYSGRYLTAEVSDAFWDLDTLKLLFTYSLAGTDDNVLVVHGGNIGVDGERHDHVWVYGQILPIEIWAHGREVHIYSLDGWRQNRQYLNVIEDYLPDGKGESFFAELRFDAISPDQYETLRTIDGKMELLCDVTVRSYDTREILEQGMLSVCVNAPEQEEWRKAYEKYYR